MQRSMSGRGIRNRRRRHQRRFAPDSSRPEMFTMAVRERRVDLGLPGLPRGDFRLRFFPSAWR